MKINHTTTLLMFSGGLDSTGAFWELMKQPEHKVLVHHMRLNNVEKRMKAEDKAVKNIIAYMNNIGDFLYTESTHEYPSYNRRFIWDGDISSFIAGTICDSLPNIKYVALGRTATDDASEAVINRIEKANKVFAAFETKAVKIYPVMSLTKVQIHNMLPVELRQHTWSCRKPICENGEFKICKRCKTCFAMDQMGIL